MPFTPDPPFPKQQGHTVRSEDWNDAMNAIAELFNKFNPTSGHRHTGAPEDAPPIQQAGIADNAVTESKIANLAVSTAKLLDGAVNTAKLGNLAVSTAKIQDGAVTFNKIAPGAVTPNIGITITQGLANNASIPIPSGFTKAECVFFAIPKLLIIPDGGITLICSVRADGTVSATQGNLTVTAVAIAKKGGW